ncbi:MAG: hypothetical protein GJ671_09215 [Alteromonadaceae bacterium]|nr:hypothetical protein [Alteromonadaceae bacterium]
MSVLLLRPEHKIAASQYAFAQAGIECVGVALQRCLPCDDLVAKIKQIEWQGVKHVVFTSSVAAKWTLPLLPELHSSCLIYAIGNGTFQTLAQWTSKDPFWCNGHRIFRAPKGAEHSEGLLELHHLQRVLQEKIVIVKGKGGRTALADTLTERGADVVTLCSYERLNLSEPVATHAWQPVDIKTIIVTSGEQVELAFAHFASQWLKRCTWLAPSQRIVKILHERGIASVFNTNGASDTDLISTLQNI